MDIRELIRKAFNEDLPISGGMGNSTEEAFILEFAWQPIFFLCFG
jgi:hypothetical protein